MQFCLDDLLKLVQHKPTSVLWLSLTICALCLANGYVGAMPVHAQSPLYGAVDGVGPGLEPCVTEADATNVTVIRPMDDWQQILTTAQPGATLLFRAGSYQSQDKLWLPTGTLGNFITLKPYNCEAVTLYTSLRPLSYTLIAGLTIEAHGVSDGDYVIRIDSEYKGKYWGNITQVQIRNNLIRGGSMDALRISDDATHITITGNHIDGGATGHNIFVTSEKLLQKPDQILISNNKLTKLYFATPAEDMLQVRDVGYVEFTYNTCTDGLTMEQCIDIKTTTQPLLIAHNFFDGEHLHQLGAGEDGADGCMVIHEGDTVADQHVIEYNYFRRCKGAAIRFASGTTAGLTSSGLLRYNLFFQTSYSEGEIPVVRAQNLEFTNNTMICGRFKLGNGDHTSLPVNTVIKNNIFYKSEIEDNTRLPAASYTCTHNLLFAILGGFTTSGCTDTIDKDPQFADIVLPDFHLRPTSPALRSGDAQNDIGAFAVMQTVAPSDLPHHFYLPTVQQNRAPEIDCTP